MPVMLLLTALLAVKKVELAAQSAALDRFSEKSPAEGLSEERANFGAPSNSTMISKMHRRVQLIVELVSWKRGRFLFEKECCKFLLDRFLLCITKSMRPV